MTTERRGDWMETVTGRQWWPLDPRPEDVALEDIAHALAHLCRFGGHCSRFYSVAEHSVLVSLVVPHEHALAALMHDATEAYLVDVPRPVKRHLSNYKELEALAWSAIAARFGLAAEPPECVHDADNAVLLAERAALKLDTGRPWNVPGTPARVPVVGVSPALARLLFLKRFDELTKGR
jgi:hypothetical protein